jgi:hypothetical protein
MVAQNKTTIRGGYMAQEEMVEVFRCTDQMVAQMAIDEVLTPAGIPSRIHNRTSSAFPAPAAMSGGFFVAVPKIKAAQAVEALRDAQEEGSLSEDGEVQEPA